MSRDLYAKLAKRGVATARVQFGLGLSEHRLGNAAAAVSAWSKVPPGSPQFAKASLGRGRLALDLGRYSEAEESFERVLRTPGPEQAEARKHLGWLYRFEGRFDDVRRLLQNNLDTFDIPEETLRGLWQLDSEPVPIEGTQTILDRAASRRREDDRVWLARANLATLLGKLDEAGELLTRCEKERPNDPVIARARLAWARASNSPRDAGSALLRLPDSEVTVVERLQLLSWLANMQGDRRTEVASLDALLMQNPGDVGALERRAELAFQAGDGATGTELRSRKIRIDHDVERYRQILKSSRDLQADSEELASLAEQIGRLFDAKAWAALKLRQQPGNRALRDRLARLRAARPPVTLPGSSRRELAAALMKAEKGPPRDLASRSTLMFEDRASSIGIHFPFENGRSPLRQLPETMSGGVALLDYDGDGHLDVYVVQGGTFPPPPGPTPCADGLFRNRGDGTFEDVSERAGIRRLPGGYGHGVTTGDYDGDGDVDLFVTRWRSYGLWRNRGDGTFEDATDAAGLGGERGWPTSAVMADLDGDSDLDLYVCHYLVWDPANPRICRRPDTSEYMYCTPKSLPSEPDRLYRNDGGRFVDISRESGIAAADSDGRGLGVVAADLDGDRRIDLCVANDMSANFLFHNLGDLKFEEIAHGAGVAANAEGGYQAGMGLACGDVDGDGRPDLAVTNFYGEGTTLYHNLGGGLFCDRSRETGLTAATRYQLGFGIAFFDADADGHLDVVQANGHVNHLRSFFPYAMPAQLLRGDGRHFTDVGHSAGGAWGAAHVGRGLAVGDLDNDGRSDVVLLTQNEPVVVLSNRTQTRNHWLTLDLQGRSSTRGAVGAVLTAHAGRRSWTVTSWSGGSYQSAHDPRIHLGLGEARVLDRLEVTWPDGRTDRYRDVRADTGYLVREGKDVLEPLHGFRNIPGP